MATSRFRVNHSRVFRHTRRGSERGAGIVEAAIITPLFVMLIFGIIETSLYLLDANSVRNGARIGARTASTGGNEALTDGLVLRDMRQAIRGASTNIDAIVVFKATGPTSSVPPECVALAETKTAGGIQDKCNVYTATQLANIDDLHFGFTIGTNDDPTLWDAKWPPTSRNDVLTQTTAPDFVGVWVRISHPSLTGVIKRMAVTSKVIYQIEPRRAE